MDSGGLLSRRATPQDDDIVSAVYPHMGYDAVGIGHQEFINGIGYFKKNLNGKLPFVSSNLTFQDEDIVFEKYRIITTASGIRVGVTSVNYNTSFRYLMRTDAVKEDEIIVGRAFDELRPVLNDLKEVSDIIVVMAHLNHEAIVRLLDEVDGYDIVIGGNNLPHFKYARKVNGKIQVQNGRDGERIGKAVFNRDMTGKMKFESYELIEILARARGYARDKKIDKLIIEQENR